MSEKADLAGLSPMAKAGMGILVVGLIVAVSGMLNLMGLDFRGLSFLDSIFGDTPNMKIYVGVPILLVGGVLFRAGGGKEHLEAQRAAQQAE